jgi:diadenosine tetraphosphate (Ap4A) HIT family hydrolase
MKNSNCVFCQILAGELPVSMIFEDEKIAVFVDLFPVNEGHLLIIPKAHAVQMEEVAPDTLQHIMATAQKMNTALRASGLPCEGVNLFAADGEVAGQEVFHFHLHIIPRFTEDGFGFKYDRDRHFKKSARSRMNEIAELVSRKLDA